MKSSDIMGNDAQYYDAGMSSGPAPVARSVQLTPGVSAIEPSQHTYIPIAAAPTACKEQPSPRIADDVNDMHNYYGFHSVVENLSDAELLHFLRFRFRFLLEELNEGLKGIDDSNADEVVDSLIDIIVVATGTLDLFKIDFAKAWNEVLSANMKKTPGMKSTRQNICGFPDLIKSAEWVAPDHRDNIGLVEAAFKNNVR